jgi:hypothetical protein
MALSDLMSHLSFITAEDIKHAHQLASTTGLPIGKCFVLLDCITQEELLQALEAQALLLDNTITLEQFVNALETVRRGWTLVDALTMLGLDAHSTRRTRLGELLSDAGAVNDTRLSSALRIGEFTSLPLGRVLTSFNAIDEIFIQLALKMQSSIRKGGLDREQAIARLKSIVRPLSINRHLKLGELLIATGILSTAQLIETLAIAESTSRLVGEVLVENGKVSEEVIATALCLQELLDAYLIDIDTATVLINQVADAIKQGPKANVVTSNPMTFFNFMRAAGYLDSRRLMGLMNEVASVSLYGENSNPKTNGKSTRVPETRLEVQCSLNDLRHTLLNIYPEDRHLINSGVVIFELVRSGKLMVNQALVIFGFRQHDLKIAS